MIKMDKERFLSLFLEELKENRALYPYYKLVDGTDSRRQFRQAYFMQRLSYLEKYIDFSSSPAILDCGCGFGTTGLFLAMNGCASRGTTLEFYADQIERRRQYWSQFGDVSLFDYAYENIFDTPPAANSYDYIILQDTLHHIEPVEKGLEILCTALKPSGKLILIEENGGSWLKSLMLFLQRGNRRVVEIYDERLQKHIQMGNENIRSEKQWRQLFQKTGFVVDDASVQYIRLLPPMAYRHQPADKVIAKEQRLSTRCPFLKHHFCMGLNMVLEKNK
ncbi:MAG: methyltransferase domain-containing protein [Bacteroidales bacterium]|nr:methyltransferase domain-containing protein [Bacteroidales bacterium]